MKKALLSSLFIIALSFSLTSPALAREGSDDQSGSGAGVQAGQNDDHRIKPGEIRKDLLEQKKEIKSEIKDMREDLKDKTKEKREDLKDRFKKEIGDKIRKELNKMTERFNAAIARLEKLADRIDSRIAKIKAEGKDTTDAEKSVADARAKIAQAKLDIAKLPNLINSVLQNTSTSTATSTASTTPPWKAPLGEVRKLAETIRKELNEAHQSLVNAVTKIKGLHIGDDKNDDDKSNSTSTATTTP